MNILIVDDQVFNHAIIKAMLEPEGYTVLFETNGKSALKTLKERKVDLIISDIFMPVMDGFQLCMECKSDSTLKKIPFVFYTATYTEKEDEEFALSLGADRFIIKPVKPEEFLTAISDVLQEAKEKKFEPTKPVLKDEESLGRYSQRLAAKLEKKVGDLQKEVAERNKAEEKIKRLNRYLESIIDNANVWFNVLDEKRQVMIWNRAAEQISGYTREEVVGNDKIWEWLYPDKKYRTQMTSTASEVIRQKKELEDYESTIRSKDGEKRIISWYSRNLLDEQGKPIGSVTLGVDVTGRRQVERALRRSEAGLRKAQQISRLGNWEWDIQSDELIWSDEMYRIFGVDQRTFEATYEGFIKAVYPVDRDKVDKAVRDALSARKPYAITHRVLLPDGEIRIVNAQGEVEFDGSANPVRMVGIEQDITEQELSEEAVRQLSAAVEQSPVSIVITDKDGDIDYVNPKFTEVSGYGYKEAIGKNPRFMKSGEHTPAFYQELWNTITSGKEWRGEMHNRKKSGELFWESVSISPVRNNEGIITHFIGINEDVTEKKSLEAQLIQSQKMEAIGTLAGGVAHDFNNMLSAIIGYSDFLLMKMDKKDQYRSFIEEIKKAGNRAASLTGQLLAFSRKQVLEKTLLDLNDVIRDMEKMLKRLIGEDIILSTSFEPSLAPVEADKGQFEQIVMNLVINARDAMPGGGKLIIKTGNVTIDIDYLKIFSYARPGRFVCVSVEDTGIGMDEETVANVFDPFFTTKETGTGLGLSVIYGIVKQHNGWINVYSEPGQGSSFRVYLPAINMQGGKTIETEVSLEGLKGNGERVLLVEDDVLLCNFVTKALKENGYIVFVAKNADEALKIFDENNGEFQLIFSDVVLPGKSGIDLVGALLGKNPGLKLLLSSGYLDEKSQWPAIAEKGYRFINKPYNLAGVLQAIKEAIKA
jgi:two-component system cell cycle sensor histidine kinase/response regulator CckA